MELVKTLGLLIIAALLATVLKQYKNEYAIIIAVAAAVIVILAVLRNIITPIEQIKTKLVESGINISYFTVAFKALGIGYITGFIADTCRDSGQTSLADKAELAGKCAIFVLSVPLVLNVLETALGFM